MPPPPPCREPLTWSRAQPSPLHSSTALLGGRAGAINVINSAISCEASPNPMHPGASNERCLQGKGEQGKGSTALK